MATFNWPGFGITAITPTLDQPAQVNRSAYTGVRAVASNPWHGKWSFKVQLATKQGDANFQAIRAFFTGLQGSVNNFHLPAVEAPQNANASVTVATYTAQGAISLALTGLTTALAAGNMITIAGQLLSLTSAGTLSGSAQTVNFQPALRTAALPVLVAPTLNVPTTSTTGGTLAAATYYYKVTALGATGETLGSNEKSQVTTGTTSTVSLSWNAIAGATGYRVYRGTATGAESVYYAPGNVTAFTDTGAANTAGTVPVSNTTQATSVETAKPYALVALTDSSFSWDIAQWRQYGLSFTVDEDVGGVDGASSGADQWTAPVISGVGGLNTPTDVVTALAASTGAGMVGANDNSSGSLFTTVAGFIAKILSSAGASIVGYIGTATGAVLRSLQSKVSDQIHIKDFAAVGDGTTDDLTPLTNFVNSANANPGKVHVLDARTFATSGALPTINASNVIIRGQGAHIHDFGTLITGTVIKYIGTSAPGLSIITIAPASGGSNQRLANIEFSGIGLDCNSGLCGRGLSVASIRSSLIVVAPINGSDRGFDCNVVASLGEARDPQKNIIKLDLRQIEAPGGLGAVFGGDSTANTSLNEIWFDGQHKNAALIQCANSDNNIFRQGRAFMVGGGTATDSVSLLGGATSAQRSRAEIFEFLTANKPLHAYGTGSYAVASTEHQVTLDTENGTPDPIIDTGAGVVFRYATTPNDQQPWTAYTPSVSAFSGTITTVGTVAGKYRQMGHRVEFKASVSITTNGTGATALLIGLPVTAGGTVSQSIAGIETAITGKMLGGTINPGATNLGAKFYDGTYPGSNGCTVVVSGYYEI